MIDRATPRVDISVIAPMHNEEGNVFPLYQDISNVMAQVGRPYEVIFVNDVSTDATLRRMKQIHCRDPQFHFVDLENNVGENWAVFAGVSKARGDVLVTIDGDYQNDPAYIPALLDELAKGYRVVSGRRRERAENLWSRLLPSRVANGLIRIVSGVGVHDCGCGLKAYGREVLENKFVPDGYMNRFSPAALGVRGHEFAEVEVIDRPRISGQSHYGLNRVFFVLRDLAALPFALRGAARWRRRFCWLKWLCLGLAPLLWVFDKVALAVSVLALALVASSNVWNLGRFISAQTHPAFRIKEYK
jgi:glycosyltransferase involved in cell wall biosynthesis